MKKALLLILVSLHIIDVNGQASQVSMFLGFGFSGADKICIDKQEINKDFIHYRKHNTLDNTFSNYIGNSAVISLSRRIDQNKYFIDKVYIDFRYVSFGKYFFKEDRFRNTPRLMQKYLPNDTINTPNWLFNRLKLTYFCFGISKSIYKTEYIELELGLYAGVLVQLIPPWETILRDSVQTNFQSFSNIEFGIGGYDGQIDGYDYGVNIGCTFFPTKRLHPKLYFTQALNDITQKNTILGDHANYWALNIGLSYNFKTKGNTNRKEGDGKA